MTDTQLRGMNMRELIVERDLTFLTKKSTDREVRVDQDADTIIDVEMKLLAVRLGCFPCLPAHRYADDLTDCSIAPTRYGNPRHVASAPARFLPRSHFSAPRT